MHIVFVKNNGKTSCYCRFKSGRHYSWDSGYGFLLTYTTIKDDKVRGENALIVNSTIQYSLMIFIAGLQFIRVGNSLIRYGKEELFYPSARKRCVEAFDATIVEFRNEQEWIEVIIPTGFYSLDDMCLNFRSLKVLTRQDISLD